MKIFLKYFWFCTLIVLISCSKDKDNSPPIITINKPIPLQNINGIDTINILATIEDDRLVEQTQVSLRNSNDQQVLSTIVESPNINKYTLNELFFFDDIHLPSGQYYFVFTATDGENTTKKYVDVLVNEEPKKRKGIFITDSNGSTSNIYLLDNAFASSSYHSFTKDLLSVGINSYNQQLVFSPTSSGNLSTIDLASNSVSWSNNSIFNYSGLLVNDNYTYAGFDNGEIKRYTLTGLSNIFGNTNSGFYPELMTMHENYLVIEQQAISNSNVLLTLHWLSSGTLAQQKNINEDILGIYTLNSNTIILISNASSTTGNIIFYDLTSGLTSTPFSISTATIRSCTEISTGVYLIAEGTNLTLLNANSFSTLPYLSGINATLVDYDSVTNQLFVVEGFNLTVYDYSTKAVVGNYNHTSIIKDLDFWYNK